MVPVLCLTGCARLLGTIWYVSYTCLGLRLKLQVFVGVLAVEGPEGGKELINGIVEAGQGQVGQTLLTAVQGGVVP